MSCAGEHCVTCSDEGIEMRVLEAREDGTALCAGEDGAPADVLTDLVGSVRPGNSVLVHAGAAIARLT